MYWRLSTKNKSEDKTMTRWTQRFVAALAVIVGWSLHGAVLAQPDCINVPSNRLEPDPSDAVSKCGSRGSPRQFTGALADKQAQYDAAQDIYYVVYENVGEGCGEGGIIEIEVGSYDIIPQIFAADFADNLLAAGFPSTSLESGTNRLIYWGNMIVNCPVTVSGIPRLYVTSTDRRVVHYAGGNGEYTMWLTLWTTGAAPPATPAPSGGNGPLCGPDEHPELSLMNIVTCVKN